MKVPNSIHNEHVQRGSHFKLHTDMSVLFNLKTHSHATILHKICKGLRGHDASLGVSDALKKCIRAYKHCILVRHRKEDGPLLDHGHLRNPRDNLSTVFEDLGHRGLLHGPRQFRSADHLVFDRLAKALEFQEDVHCTAKGMIVPPKQKV